MVYTTRDEIRHEICKVCSDPSNCDECFLERFDEKMDRMEELETRAERAEAVIQGDLPSMEEQMEIEWRHDLAREKWLSKSEMDGDK